MSILVFLINNNKRRLRAFKILWIFSSVFGVKLIGRKNKVLEIKKNERTKHCWRAINIVSCFTFFGWFKWLGLTWYVNFLFGSLTRKNSENLQRERPRDSCWFIQLKRQRWRCQNGQHVYFSRRISHSRSSSHYRNIDNRIWIFHHFSISRLTQEELENAFDLWRGNNVRLLIII